MDIYVSGQSICQKSQSNADQPYAEGAWIDYFDVTAIPVGFEYTYDQETQTFGSFTLLQNECPFHAKHLGVNINEPMISVYLLDEGAVDLTLEEAMSIERLSEVEGVRRLDGSLIVHLSDRDAWMSGQKQLLVEASFEDKHLVEITERGLLKEPDQIHYLGIEDFTREDDEDAGVPRYLNMDSLDGV